MAALRCVPSRQFSVGWRLGVADRWRRLRPVGSLPCGHPNPSRTLQERTFSFTSLHNKLLSFTNSADECPNTSVGRVLDCSARHILLLKFLFLTVSRLVRAQYSSFVIQNMIKKRLCCNRIFCVVSFNEAIVWENLCFEVIHEKIPHLHGYPTFS